MTSKSNTVLDRLALVLLCALVFSLPLEKAVEVPGVGTISRIIGFAAFAAGAAAMAWRRSLRRPNAALLLAAAFVLWSGCTYFWSAWPPGTLSRIGTLVQLFAMLWLIWELCREPAVQVWLMRAYTAGAAVSSVFTMVRFARRQQTYYRRYATPGFDPNDLGVTLALAIPMLLYLASRARGMWPWVYRLLIALVIAAILLTASRTALVAACLGFIPVFLDWHGTSLQHRITGLVLLVLLLLGPVILAPRASRQRLATLPAELTRGTVHGRTHIWKAGLKVVKRHWFAGAGAGAFPEAVQPWLGKPPVAAFQYTAHSVYLSVLAETGLVGVVIFGLLLLVLILFAWMLQPAERALWIAVLTTWAAGVSTLTWENRKPTWLLFALIMTAWAFAYRARDRAS